MKVINLTKNTLLADNAELVTGLGQRLKGLLGRTGLAKGEGLVIEPCSSIHTFFMRFSIDVVFLNKALRVIKTIENMRPFRMSNPFFFAHLAVELPVGAICDSNTERGDQIEIKV